MRFAWMPLGMLLAFVACGDGPSVYLPSGRYDLAWTDAVQDVAAGRDWGRDPGAGAEVVGADGLAADTPFDAPETGDVQAGDVAGDGGATGDLAMDGAAQDLGDPGDADAWADDPGATDPGPTDSGGFDPGATDPGPTDSGPSDPGTSDPGTAPSTLAIRLVAANLSTDGQTYPADRPGRNLMKGTRGDVFLVQEFNCTPDVSASYRQMADDICGTECSYNVGTGNIPNGVVSRWPIVASGYWDDPTITDRNLDWVRIDLPGDKDLVAISVHLKYDDVGRQKLGAQVVAGGVVDYRAAHPGCCWYVVGGDFNGPSAVSNDGFGYYDGEAVFSVTGPDPVGEDGLEGTNSSREKQYDFVLLDTALRPYQVASVFTSTDGNSALTYPSGLVFDSRNFSQAELDRYFPGALVSDSADPDMQHMAVVKDVVVPR